MSDRLEKGDSQGARVERENRAQARASWGTRGRLEALGTFTIYLSRAKNVLPRRFCVEFDDCFWDKTFDVVLEETSSL